MSNIVKLSDRKKAKEQQARKAAAEQRARQSGASSPTRAKLPLLVLSIAIVFLGIFWEPVLGFLASLFDRG